MQSVTFPIFVGCALALACSTTKPANDAGPAQKAGAAVDESARDAKQSAKEAGEKADEAGKKAADKLQEKRAD